MVRYILKILQKILQNFLNMSDSFGTLCINFFMTEIPTYKNQFIDLQSKFLYDRYLRHERVKGLMQESCLVKLIIHT